MHEKEVKRAQTDHVICVRRAHSEYQQRYVQCTHSQRTVVKITRQVLWNATSKMNPK